MNRTTTARVFGIAAGIVGIGAGLAGLTALSAASPVLQAAMVGVDLGAAVAALVAVVVLRDPKDNWIEEQFAA